MHHPTYYLHLPHSLSAVPRLNHVGRKLPENGNASHLLGRLLAMLKLQGRDPGCRLLGPGEFNQPFVLSFDGTFLVQMAHLNKKNFN
jgi:hypothetical protein